MSWILCAVYRVAPVASLAFYIILGGGIRGALLSIAAANAVPRVPTLAKPATHPT